MHRGRGGRQEWRVFAAAGFVLASAVVVAATQRPARAAGAPLVLTSFVQKGRTDVRRNEVLEFRFSTKVKAASVGDVSLAIEETGGPGGPVKALGARVLRGNSVLFDPQRTQANYDNSRKANATVVEKDRPAGFAAFQDFRVSLPSAGVTLKSAAGAKLLAGFSGSFRTNGTYDDPVPGQPYFVGDHGTGLLGFVPPKSGGLVEENASIVLEFDEPVLPDSLDPSSTVKVERVATAEQVPGRIVTDPNDPSGRRVLFVPAAGFGSDTPNQRGWLIRVTLTTGVTDLAGNALQRPIVFAAFETRYAPSKPPCFLVTETFADQSKMDAQTVLSGGEWNTTEKGALVGGAPTTYPDKDVRYTAAGVGLAVTRAPVTEPLVASAAGTGGPCTAAPNGSRAQMLYLPADVGGAAAIVGIGWGPSSNAVFSASHADIAVSLGHTTLPSLTSGFASNVNVGTMRQAYRGVYDLLPSANVHPPGTDDGYQDLPRFTTPFEWNGVNNLVVDVAALPAGNCQLLRSALVTSSGYALRRAVARSAAAGSADAGAESRVCDLRFHKRRRTTQAVSLWYETTTNAPKYLPPVTTPVAQPLGTGFLVEMEGADGKPDPFNPGRQIPDPATGTGFTPTYAQIDGHRYFRFRISMFANLTTNATPRLTSVLFPYCY
jgi:hypothetical protein